MEQVTRIQKTTGTNKMNGGLNNMKKRYLLGIVMIIAVVVALALMSVTPGFVSDVADDDGNYAFYTERYWQAAQERANQPQAFVADDENGDGFSYYTERYWQAAANRDAQLEADVEDGNETSHDYAYYTERYWDAAANRDAQDGNEASHDYAYYTEQYWEAAANRQRKR